ncbi:SDR family oxidoreductase [Aggregicoccus sp. 17bor-14]|uniref:SDR family NAD(P)-dependent oxidoreductase n=1 Tax=Myxococcaceae TaxID=31 RepID=UPI00129C3CA1|nr:MULTISPECIES: SDR family NAD(P)-dependent oxidoreductase [Myxococcaceae]MBF5043241.1 SDR family oxidoreductase [Simulacricoccus sp. 17bor-14]MRI88998.1 SDR family oxidoreductase [Aggregicoccus sp. 17bor-14]
MSRLVGKVAIVTGASSGLGRAIALRYALEGASLVLGDIDEDGGRETLALLPEPARARSRFRRLDVTREEDCEAAVAEAVSVYGRLDILVANAGIGAPGFIATLRKEDFERVVAVNLTGVFLCAKHAFRAMQKNGGGSILTMASVAGLQGTMMLGGYGPSKAGTIQLTQTLALEGARFNIRANAIAPVWTQTPMVDAFVKGLRAGEEQGKARLTADIPLGRLGRPEDVAAAAVFLASDEASFITGVVLPLDGGHLAGRIPQG